MGQIRRFMRKIVCFPIRVYQYLFSTKPCCRFYPSCSQYALEAIESLGIIRGIFFASIRLLRCHPFSKGGYDPILPNHQRDNSNG